jgi:hypothetical protein
MYAGAWLVTTNRHYWSNVKGTLSGPVARQRSVNLTFSTSVLTGRGQDFDIIFNATRPLVTC